MRLERFRDVYMHIGFGEALPLKPTGLALRPSADSGSVIICPGVSGNLLWRAKRLFEAISSRVDGTLPGTRSPQGAGIRFPRQTSSDVLYHIAVQLL
jgi:hypothetical protein